MVLSLCLERLLAVALMTCALQRGHYTAIVVEVTQEKKQKGDKEEKDEVAVMVVVREDGV